MKSEWQILLKFVQHDRKLQTNCTCEGVEKYFLSSEFRLNYSKGMECQKQKY